MKLLTLLKTALLAVASLAALALPGQAATTAYSDGDLFLGFRAPGATQDYLVNLGPAAQFTGATGAATLNLGSIGPDLAATFTAGWYNRADLFFGVIGGTAQGVNGDPANTLYATRNVFAPWEHRKDGAQASTLTLIATMGSTYADNTSSTNSPTGLVQSSSATNSYATFQPGGTIPNSGGISFAAFNPSNEGTPGRTLYLFRVAPSSAAPGQELVGRISLSSAGVVTFTPGAAAGTTNFHFEQSTYSLSEADTAGRVTLTIVREGDASAAGTVQLNTANGSAQAGGDFTARTNLQVPFAAGQTVANVTVEVTNRAGYQGNRTFTAQLSSPSGSATIAAPDTATVTILETEAPPAGDLSFSSATSTFGATNGTGAPATLEVAVVRANGTNGEVSATVTASGGTLAEGTDFTLTSPITFANGATTATASVELKAIAVNKLPGSFVLTLSAPQGGANLGTQTSTTVTVVASSAVMFSSATYSGAEGIGDVTVAVTVNRLGSTGTGSVQVAVTGGTATAGTDFTLPGTPVTLTWADGDSTPKSFNLTIKQDAELEAAGETVTLALLNATGTLVIGTPDTTTVQIGDADAAMPVLTLTSPKANAKFTGTVVTVAGKATDASGVNRVLISLNGALVQTVASPAGGSFSVSIPAEQGTNEVSVVAIDNANNASAPQVRRFTFTISRPNLAGTYNGLLTSAAAGAADLNGLLNVKVAATGAFTGKATLAGTSFALSGTILSSGQARFKTGNAATLPLIKKVGKVSTTVGYLALNLNTATGAEVTGTITSTAAVGTTLATTGADRAYYTAAKAPAAPLQNVPVTLLDPATNKGKYTAAFLTAAAPNNGLAANAYPQGAGFANVTISTAGVVSVKGKLADGSAISYSNTLALDGTVPFFVQLYSKAGSITGTLVFNPNAAATDLTSTGMQWFKPAGLAKQTLYPQGWPNGINVSVQGSKYVAPSSKVPGTIFGTDFTGGTVRVTQTGSDVNGTNDGQLAANGKFTAGTAGSTINGLKLAFANATGLFTGSLLPSGGGKAAPVAGVVLQKSNQGFGYVLLAPESGLITVQPTALP